MNLLECLEWKLEAEPLRGLKSAVALRFRRDTPGHRGPRRGETRRVQYSGGRRGNRRWRGTGRRRRSDPRVDVSLAFERIRGDRSHGARALADEALRALAELLEGWAHLPEARLRSRVRQVARALEEAQPAMGPFLRWAEDLRRLARTTPSDDLARSARSWTRRERSRLAAEMPRLIRTSRRRFPRGARHVVTLSRSQTVLLALSALSRARRPSRVSVLESLPGGEGRLFREGPPPGGPLSRGGPGRKGPR